MGQECETASCHIDRSGDLDALDPGRQDGTGAGVERVKGFLLIILADDDDERRGWMATAPLSELFASMTQTRPVHDETFMPTGVRRSRS